MYKHLFKHFFKENPGVRHFAAHSHHYWPDCSREAQLKYWDDSAKYVDEKWSYFFSDKVPEYQSYVAEILNLSHPEQITIAGNTHELVYRLMSSLGLGKKKLKILTTDSEFYSFDRQLKRLFEEDLVEVNIVKLEPYVTFEERLLHEAGHDHDLTFFSHVFFNNGFRISNLDEIVEVAARHSTVCVDIYHSFFAIPMSLKAIEDKAYFVGGSYKYSMGGEGCGFMASPKGNTLKPVNTGWMAEIDYLSDKELTEVYYSDSGLKFAGATIDFSALYRQTSVFEMLKAEDITVNTIHEYVQNEQAKFIDEVNIQECKLLNHGIENQGHFLCLDYETSAKAENFSSHLRKQNIITDRRKSIVRFGFSLYSEGPYKFTL